MENFNSMSLSKHRAASLGSVALRRTKQEPTDSDSKAELAGVVGITRNDRTVVSTGGQRQRQSQHTGAEQSGRPAQKELPSFRLDPREGTRFSPEPVEQLVREVLVARLKDETYDGATCKRLSQELAAAIMEELKTLSIRRYKMVAVVSIGSLSEQPGLQFGSRCLWDDNTDSFASVKFTNGSLFAVAMIYGLYYE